MGLWTLRGVFVLIFMAVVTAFMAVGQQMHAPVWLRDRIEARLEQALSGVQIRFGDVSFVIHEEWRPRLRLRDVTVQDAEGRQIARLSDMRASLSMRALLRGEFRPKRIQLSGAQVSLLRDADGTFSLTVGTESAPMEQAPTLAQLIETSDDVFLSPSLSALASFELDAITLDYRDLRQGRSWTLDGGHLQVTRGDGAIRIATGFSVLGGRDYASAVEANYTSQLGSPEAEFGITVTDLPADDIAGQSPALSWLDVLDAPISGALRGSIDGQGALGPVYSTLQIGAGVVQPTPQTRPIPFESARTYFTYDPARQWLDFDEVSIVSAWGSALAEGKAFLEGVQEGVLRNLSAQFRLTGITVNPADMFPEPLQLSRAEIDFQMQLAPFRLQLGQMTVSHEDRRLHLSGDLAGSPEGWGVNLDAGIDRMTPAQLLRYWPKGLAPKPRAWVTMNLTDGNLSDLDFALRLKPGEKPVIYADFEFDEADITYARTLPPLTNAQGQASLVDQRFTATAQRGWVVPDEGGPVDASGSSFIIPDIGIRKAAPGIARLRARGSATAALSLLDRPPLSVMTKAGLPVDLGEGDVQIEGTLALPLRDKVTLEDMEFHLTGTLTDVFSDKLVPGIAVSADRLDVSGTQDQVAISGNGAFGSVPMQGTWVQPIGGTEGTQSRLTGQIELSPRLMTEIHAGLPQGMLTGLGVADMTVDLGGGAPPVLTAQSDLVGVGLAVPELGWRKATDRSGTMDVKATLGSQMRVDELNINAAGLRATGAITFTPDHEMERVSFSSFEVGNWLAAPIELIERGRAVPDIRILGGVLDMRTTTAGTGDGGGSGGGAGPRMEVQLDRLQVTDTIALTGLRGNFETTGGIGGNFTARINSGAPVTGTVTPRGGRSGVLLQSDDAGGVLRSSGILTQAREGDFRLALEPVRASGYYDAALGITNTRVTDAPAMAALLNAISLVGLLDEMSGQGIVFSAIDSKMRISPTEVTVLSGSAVGPSIGLSFDGRVDTERRLLDLRGAITPLYLLNAVGSVLTRKGEGLFAFNYALKGPLDDPQVTVNPLSGLAPLFLRNLMRPPPPKTPADAGTVTLPAAPRLPPPDLPRGEDR